MYLEARISNEPGLENTAHFYVSLKWHFMNLCAKGLIIKIRCVNKGDIAKIYITI